MIDDVNICECCAGWGYVRTLNINDQETDQTCSSCLGAGYRLPNELKPKINPTKNIIELVLSAWTQKERKQC